MLMFSFVLSIVVLVFAARAPRIACAVLLAFPVFALAQAGVPSPEQLEPFLRALVDAVQGGKWQIVAILVGIGLVWAIRKWGVKVWPVLGSKRAGAITALLGGSLPVLGAALLSGSPITVNTVANAIITGLGMIGGWVGVRRILFGDVGEQVAAEAAKTVVPVPPAATLEELGRELDAPVK
jgi:hypothetical protein